VFPITLSICVVEKLFRTAAALTSALLSWKIFAVPSAPSAVSPNPKRNKVCVPLPPPELAFSTYKKEC